MRKVDYLNLVDRMYKDLEDTFSSKNKYHLWPHIRIQSNYAFHVLRNSQDFKKEKMPSKPSLHGLASRLRAFIVLLLRCTEFPLLVYKYRKILKNKMLVVGYANHKTLLKNGLEKNIYIDPFKDELQTAACRFSTLLFLNHRINFSDDVFLNKLFYKIQLLNNNYVQAFSTFNEERALYEDALSCGKWLTQNGMSKEDSEHIASVIYSAAIQSRNDFPTFKYFLSITSPRAVWLYCYYDNKMMSLTRAANANKIPVIDYQHSNQYDHHFAYALWRNIDLYSDYFPSHFWVWRLSDERRIASNFKGIQYQPRVLRGGNLFLRQQKESFRSNKTSNIKSILICLQGMWIPPFIERAIGLLSEWKWYFRLHPRYPGDRTRLEELHLQYPDKVEITHANEWPLYELLNSVSYNITSFSGTALEAQDFGVQNIIFGLEGHNAFNEQIENKEFFYVDSSEELIEILLNSKKLSFENEDNGDMVKEYIMQLTK